MPFKYGPKTACSLTHEGKVFYPEFHTYTNFPPIPSCEFKKGIAYTINNYIPDLSKVPPVFESGDYAMEAQGFKNDEFINGFRVYASVLYFSGCYNVVIVVCLYKLKFVSYFVRIESGRTIWINLNEF